MAKAFRFASLLKNIKNIKLYELSASAGLKHLPIVALRRAALPINCRASMGGNFRWTTKARVDEIAQPVYSYDFID